jgi:ABC-type multidrug transport system ATPase subunit
VKHNRAIVLTTHNMEEADILADRVAIIAAGVLRCGDCCNHGDEYSFLMQMRG